MPEVKGHHAIAAPLEGKIVLVTGASSGIGRGIAVACAKAGADVATTYRTNRPGAERAMEEVRALGRDGLALRADIARPDELGGLVEALLARFGRVDVWINNAGADILTGPGARLTRVEKLDLLLAVDLRGTMLASWVAVEQMERQPEGGSIINMSWDRAIPGLRGESPQLFAAVKGGVLSFSKSLARSVAPKIRVNVLGPGWIETAFGEQASAGFKQRVQEGIPLRRWGHPQDVGNAAVFLASDASAYVTGQMIMVNGGDVM